VSKQDCQVPSIVPPPGGHNNYFGTDIGYYGYNDFGGEQSSGRPTVNSFIGYYYGYQALGLMMLQEADRFEAQQAVGQTNLTPEEVGDLCDLQKYPAAAGDCVDAEVWTNRVYENLLVQFEAAGVPYTDEKVMWNARNDALFVRSLEDFTRVVTPGCRDPLTAAHPCGVTVATWDTSADAMDVPYAGYGIWHTMTSDQVTDVIGSRGHLTPGQYMDTLGFEKAEHKIILTSTKTQFKTPSSPPRVKPPNPGYPSIHGTMVCFFHTDVTGGQFCGSDDVSNRLLELTGGCSGYARGWQTNGSLPTNNNNFFAAGACGTSWNTQPGWLVGNTGSNTRQYRWPLLITGHLTCTAGRSHTNVEGVATRCGATFAGSFNALVPRPTTCPGTTAGVCRAQVTRSPARLRITRVRAIPLRRGCATETRQDEREITARAADATCRHFRLTVMGTISARGNRTSTVAGAVQVTVDANLPRGRTKRNAHTKVRHGHWRVSLVVPGVNHDRLPPMYQITAHYDGDRSTAQASRTRRIRIESERAGL
jgi:hypothetical protein